MTLKPNPSENPMSEPEEIALVAPQSSIDPSEEALWYNLDEESVLAKHTLLLDSEAEPEPSQASKRQAKSKYVQGILQEQVYIITNLLRDKSQTLRQPQMVWTIGRNRLAALPLRDRKMSRHHAVILYAADEGFYLVDLNSMNGSYVNGIRVQQRQLLKDGDQVCLGDTQFSFYISSQQRTLEPIHSEVLMRLNNQELRTTPFVDYLEEGMDIEFKLARE